MRARAGLGQENKHGGLARHDLFTSKPVKPAFCTKPCLSVRLARFLARFFRAYWAGPTHLDSLRAKLRQGNELAGLDGPARFSNRAWRVRPNMGRASPGRATRLAIFRFNQLYRNKLIIN
jgi:hypothetical protein